MHGHPMETNIVIYYDKEFVKNFEELKTLLDAGDRQKLYQFLLDISFYWINSVSFSK